MAVQTLDDLLLDELKDLYSAEKQAVRVYPRLSKAIQSAELKQAMQTHLEETKGQVERLDRIFETLEKRSGGKTCEAMKGLIEEAQERVEAVEEGPVRDAGLIGAAQRMEHYEIAAYGTVIALAKALGQEEIANLLAETLAEEKRTDEKLTEVSTLVNQQALGDLENDEDEDEDEQDDEDEEDEEDEEDSKPAPAKKAAAKAPAKKSGNR